MISALCDISYIDPHYLEKAIQTADFIVKYMIEEKNDELILYRSYRHGRSNIHGFDSDYTNVIQGNHFNSHFVLCMHCCRSLLSIVIHMTGHGV